MAWVLQCDKCKTIFEGKEGYRRLLLGYFRGNEELRNKNKSCDLCPNCMSQIINFLEEL